MWDPEVGGDISPVEAAGLLHDAGLPVTVTGGEPFDQAAELCTLLMALYDLDPDRHVVVYTGYTLEDLVRTGSGWVLVALAAIDVLVDGPYVRELDAPGMQYRGSSNQRVIDVQATFQQPAAVTLTRGPVTLDWDTPEIVLTDGGDLLAASPVAREFSGVGEMEGTRRCGEAGHGN
jgi:anaerobic ribonucleoside-triphosphate reductase activating protein